MTTLTSALASIVGDDHLLTEPGPEWLTDASIAGGAASRAEAVVLPGDAQQVAAVVAECYARETPIVARGGGTGYAGGAVPVAGGVVVSVARLDRLLALDPVRWRMRVQAGMTTATVQRLARENGLAFPPDPGAGEQSHIGGNIATNAGGPHAFKYGVTGDWVLGLEAVVAPGELIEVGGPIRKDVAGYDLASLLVGSEGTLGLITSAWLRLIPAPEAQLALAAFYPDTHRGTEAIEAALGSGVVPAALEYLDAHTLALAGGSFPGGCPAGAGFLLIAEADGGLEAARHDRNELARALAVGALEVRAPAEGMATRELWRWRSGVSLAVSARHGAKLSEDIVVPVERLGEAVTETVAIGERHGLAACSWGHAGDGNLHSTLLLDPSDPDQLARAERAAEDLFALAIGLGGSVSGEHGLGRLKSGQLNRQWPAGAVRWHAAIKAALDPRGLLNPGVKRP
ncbi:MAG TPA: FAD-linked oxidase C-terminal domain-containing protein [Solirubrobacteraceae bacterium]|jgi:glycolate oxidase subunit GlcD|nr:FAD-linked oxidase C-terminal domain-containing protein [Solirubrobacteraceae bacterium]